MASRIKTLTMVMIVFSSSFILHQAWSQDEAKQKDDSRVAIERKAKLTVKYMGIEFGKKLMHPAAYRDGTFDILGLKSWAGVNGNQQDLPSILQTCHQYVLVDESNIVVGLVFHLKDSKLASERNFYTRRDEENLPDYKNILTAEELFALTTKALIKKYDSQIKIGQSGTSAYGKIRVGSHDFTVDVKHKQNSMRQDEEFRYYILDQTVREGNKITVDIDKF